MSSSATPALAAQRNDSAAPQADHLEAMYRWPEPEYYQTMTKRRLKSVDDEPPATAAVVTVDDDEEERGDIDVTSLITRRKKKPAALPSAAAVPEDGGLPPVLYDTHKTMPAFRCLDVLDDHLANFSNDDISLLVNTLSQLTGQRADENESPTLSSPTSPTAFKRFPAQQQPASHGAVTVDHTFTPAQQQVCPAAPQSSKAQASQHELYQRQHAPYFSGMQSQPPPNYYLPEPNYYNMPQPPSFPQDSQIIVKGHNLTHWRAFFLSLAYAAPSTLQSYVTTLGSKTTPHRQATCNTGKGQNGAGAPVVRPPPSEGRFKQIARGKSTREYLAYIQAVPKDQRQEGVDPATPRVEGSSWREFQAEVRWEQAHTLQVRAWKRMLHRKYEYLESLKGDSTV